MNIKHSIESIFLFRKKFLKQFFMKFYIDIDIQKITIFLNHQIITQHHIILFIKLVNLSIVKKFMELLILVVVAEG